MASKSASHQKLKLKFTGINLPNTTDSLTDIDPYLDVFEGKELLGRTEVIMNDVNPKWLTTVPVTYIFESNQILDIRIKDDSGKPILSFEKVSLSDLMMNRPLVRGSASLQVTIIPEEDLGKILKLRMTLNDGDRFGRRRASLVGMCFAFEAQLVFTAPKDGNVLGKSPWCMIKGDQVDFSQLECEYGLDAMDVQLTLSTRIHSPSDVGQTSKQYWTHTTTIDTLREGRKLPRIVESIRVLADVIKPKFAAYVLGGLQLHTRVAIDFTGSNEAPLLKTSLHRANNIETNPYYLALAAVLPIVEKYSYDGGISMSLFGVQHNLGATRHAMDLGTVHGAEAALSKYTAAVESVVLGDLELSSPTYFAPTLEATLSEMHKQRHDFTADRQHYTVQFIITDGQINDMPSTCDALYKACAEPMSVIIVGVGTADFTSMDVLDGDDDKRLTDSKGRPCSRDMVQFVAMNEILKKRGNGVKLEHELLRELPGQVEGFGVSHGVYPRPGIGQKKGRSGSFHDELMKHVVPKNSGKDEGKMDDAEVAFDKPKASAYPALDARAADSAPPSYQEAVPSAPSGPV